MKGMQLIDRGGRRTRPVCREHAHVGRNCPKCKSNREWNKRRYQSIKALQDWLETVDRVDYAV